MTQTWTIERPQVLIVPDGEEVVRSLKVGIAAGRVDVVPHQDGGAARIEVGDLSGRAVQVTWDGAELTVGYPRPAGLLAKIAGPASLWRHERDVVRLSVSVPDMCAVSVSTVSADALINGIRNNVAANTVCGSLTLDDVVGDVTVSTVSGDVDCHALSGSFVANSVSGELTAQASRFEDVKLNTVSGNVVLDLTAGHSRLHANAVSGDLTVRIPAGSGYEIHSRSASGYVEIDGHRLPRAAAGTRDSAHEDGAGQLIVTAHAVSGNVVLLRGENPGQRAAG